MATATANGNGETATKERQRNDGNQALVAQGRLSTYNDNHRFYFFIFRMQAPSKRGA